MIVEPGLGVNNAVIEALLTRQQWLVTLATLLASGLVVQITRIVRPIMQLSREADRLSLGDLEGPVAHDLPGRSVTKLRVLAQAIKRLRTSLALAINRLRPQYSGRQSQGLQFQGLPPPAPLERNGP